MLEERDDLLDRLFHAEEFAERRVAPDDAVAENPGEALVVSGVDELGLADAGKHPLGRARVRRRLALAELEIVLEAHLLVLRRGVIRTELVKHLRHRLFPKRNRTRQMPIQRRYVPNFGHGTTHGLVFLGIA